jgi:hypothetical protein
VELANGASLKLALGRVDAKPAWGTFRLGHESHQTSPIASNASADTLETALNALTSVAAGGGLTVEGGVGGPWMLYWNQPGARTGITSDAALLWPQSQVLAREARPGDGDRAAIVSLKLKQLPAAYQDQWQNLPAPTLSVTRLVEGGSGHNETQRIRLAPLPFAGSFTLRFGDQSTAPLVHNASATAITEALNGLAGIEAGNCAVTEVAGGEWDVQFIGTLANASQPLLSGDASSLRGYRGKGGVLALDVPGIEDLLEGKDSVPATLELEVTDNGSPQTWLQISVTVLNDMIEGAAVQPVPFPVVVALSPLAEVRFPGGTSLQLKDRVTGEWITVFMADGTLTQETFP